MMEFVADLHIHSHYSRATSKDLTFEHLSKWAQLKGIHVVGTGDIAHPGWLQEMKDKLEPAEDGLFKLKTEFTQGVPSQVPSACQGMVRFMLAGEISSIYKKNDQVRKIHNVIFAPTLEAVEKIQAALEKIGNIRADGRPILGLDSRDLLEIILDIDEQNYLIPAHIWTPWFSLLGSKSGFDSVEECFEDLTPYIFALETGLSSDPPMNWRVSFLDRYTLVSNSDAHSPQKLAREANLFDTELSYPAIFAALKSGNPNAFLGTFEFFPEEGKYHFDGHRKCEIRWDPPTTLAHQGLCPVCGKPVTVGVMHRVETLADRPEGSKPARTQPYDSLIPLPEVLGEVLGGISPTSKKVGQLYETLLTQLGSELAILRELPLEQIERVGGPLLAEGIRRMRRGEVNIAAGYDGDYGLIKLFDPQERAVFSAQLTMFEPAKKPHQPAIPEPAISSTEIEPAKAATLTHWSPATLLSIATEPGIPPQTAVTAAENDLLTRLNPQQQKAARCTDTPLIIVAGPGTGKTRTLTYRVAHLIAHKGVAPENMLAITFTNKAAEEMAARLNRLLGPDVTGKIIIRTFHAFGAMLLRQAGEQVGLWSNFAICSEREREILLKQLYPKLSEREINQYLDDISVAKNQLQGSDSLAAPLAEIYQNYQQALVQKYLLDFDDLIFKPVQLLEAHPGLLAAYRQRFRWISVDEYQDINHAQYRLLRLLAGPEVNLCVIGDPDQAIYGFRGARREYFLQFSQDFPTAKTMHLNQNYRSTQLILAASGQVISQNPTSDRVKIWSEFADQTRLEVYPAPTDKAEAEYVVHEIEKMVGGLSYFSIDSARVTDTDGAGRTFADFAVLYRLGAQSQPLIEAFQRSGIPYQTVGQTPLSDYKEVRLILAGLWFLHHPDATFYLDQVGSKKQAREIISFLQGLQDMAAQPVSGIIEQLHQFIANRSLLHFEEKGYERIQQLRRRAIPFGNRLTDFLETMALQKETDFYDARADRVTLMTLHAAKGLEFPVVFMVGCEEGLLPYQREDKPFDVEEERRLFYVGMTRARHKLVLTYARTRFLFGQKVKNSPSRFVTDIEDTLKEIKKMAAREFTPEKLDNIQLRLF
jgi:DNA helicase-2/ATP-dependent DNA helicase PcrA